MCSCKVFGESQDKAQLEDMVLSTVLTNRLISEQNIQSPKYPQVLSNNLHFMFPKGQIKIPMKLNAAVNRK